MLCRGIIRAFAVYLFISFALVSLGPDLQKILRLGYNNIYVEIMLLQSKENLRHSHDMIKFRKRILQ